MIRRPILCKVQFLLNSAIEEKIAKLRQEIQAEMTKNNEGLKSHLENLVIKFAKSDNQDRFIEQINELTEEISNLKKVYKLELQNATDGFKEQVSRLERELKILQQNQMELVGFKNVPEKESSKPQQPNQEIKKHIKKSSIDIYGNSAETEEHNAEDVQHFQSPETPTNALIRLVFYLNL